MYFIDPLGISLRGLLRRRALEFGLKLRSQGYLFFIWGRSSSLIGPGVFEVVENFLLNTFLINQLFHAFLGLQGVVLASNSLHDLWGQKNHAHVHPYRNFRKSSEIFFSYGLTVNRIMSLSGHPSIINKITLHNKIPSCSHFCLRLGSLKKKP